MNNTLINDNDKDNKMITIMTINEIIIKDADT